MILSKSCFVDVSSNHLINMATTTTILLPGDEVSVELLPQPTNKKKALTLGPGLRHIPPETIKASIAGALATDNKKNAAWIDFNSGRVRQLSLLFLVKTGLASNFLSQLSETLASSTHSSSLSWIDHSTET